MKGALNAINMQFVAIFNVRRFHYFLDRRAIAEEEIWALHGSEQFLPVQ
jgi:hypothetical protein